MDIVSRRGRLTTAGTLFSIGTVAVHERETGKRFCFDVVSPYRSWTLQAESVESLNAWVEALRASIEHNFYSLSEPQV